MSQVIIKSIGRRFDVTSPSIKAKPSPVGIPPKTVFSRQHTEARGHTTSGLPQPGERANTVRPYIRYCLLPIAYCLLPITYCLLPKH